MLADEDYTRKKDRHKKKRAILQGIILAVLLAICIDALFVFSTYKPYAADQVSQKDRGFVALSYFGVDRTGTHDLIGSDLLDEHLTALQRNGFVTITGKDIENYYKNGQNLPEHALFLNFEDGRRDTVVFAEKLLEKHNYHGTVSTYADNLKGDDSKFLRPKELLDLTKHGYWELGSNGYRLYFINVFDRWNHYLGNMNPVIYSHMASVLGRKYNHYLMDYIRDDKDFPVESYQAMKDRITDDYTLLRDTYTEDLGYVPSIYTLMHANTSRFGNHPDVSAVNEKWIRQLFAMNFNREGYSVNNRKSSIYDLTRMEPRAYWPVNHLLMRIKDDGYPDIQFVNGDTDQYAQWNVEKGAAEFKNETIYLTTDSKKNGLMALKDHNNLQDVRLSVDLKGNVFGTQKLYLRAGEGLSRYVVVGLVNNHLVVGEKAGGAEKTLQDLDLQLFDGHPYDSVEQDQKAVAEQERQVMLRYAPNTTVAQNQLEQLQNVQQQKAKTVEEGSPEYHPTLSYHKRGSRQVEIKLHGNLLTVNVDGRPAVANVPVTVTGPGKLFLESKWPGYGYSQTNLADDVYDGVFAGLKVQQWAPEKNEKTAVFYDLHYSGWKKYKYKARLQYTKVLDWALGFVKYRMR